MSSSQDNSEGSDAPRWRRRKQARPQELVDAALELFIEQGFAATKLSDIAERAGVSKGTIYLYFPSKEELLKAAVRRSVVPILDFGDKLVVDESTIKPCAELLEMLAFAWIRKFEEFNVSGIPKLIISESKNFPELGQFFVEVIIERARALFGKIIARGVSTGEFRQVDVKDTVHLFMAPIVWAQIYEHSIQPYDTRGLDRQTFIPAHVEFFLRGLKA